MYVCFIIILYIVQGYCLIMIDHNNKIKYSVQLLQLVSNNKNTECTCVQLQFIIYCNISFNKFSLLGGIDKCPLCLTSQCLEINLINLHSHNYVTMYSYIISRNYC